MPSSRKALRNAAFLNPRASNSWSKDESKFGKKLLEKMGWQEGQGLGAQNQGISENIKYRLKLDNKGLGYRIKEDQWVEVRNEFSDLLAQLSQSIENENELNIKDKRSLKAASESSRSRVHYHKFTHGKDISRYNKEDLIGILGEKKEIESAIPDKKEFIQSGNMEEYFENKKKKLQTNGVRSVKSAENVTENLEPEEKQESVLIEPLVKKKRKRKRSIELIENLDQIENNSTNTENSTFPTNKKKSKKKVRNLEDKSEPIGEENDLSTVGEIQFEISRQESVAIDEPVKKKKKRKHSNEENDMISIENNSMQIENLLPQTNETKSKKKEKLVNQLKKNISDNNGLSEMEELPKKSKKRKAANNDLPIVIEENKVENHELLDENFISVQPLVKKKKKRKLSDEQIENLDSVVNEAQNSLNSSPQKKLLAKKKKKRKHSDEQIDNLNSIEGHAKVIENQSVSQKIEKESKKNLKNVNEPIKETSTDLCSATRIMEKSPSKCDRKIDVKPLSKAERIVQKSRLLKRLQSKEVTHAFIGTNLTEILGYGNAPS